MCLHFEYNRIQNETDLKIWKMDTAKSLYGDLCHLFLLVSNCQSSLRISNPRVRSQIVSKKCDKEARERRQAVRNGFKSLFKASICNEGNFSEEFQLQTWLFTLSQTIARTDFCAIEKAIAELRQSDSLSRIFPVLKLLSLVNPIKTARSQKLKLIDYEHASNGINIFCMDIKDLNHCIPYQVLSLKDFEATSINYSPDELYGSNVLTKLKSTSQLDELDLTHSKLFGALENPPKNLNYLGVFKNTQFHLGIKTNQSGKYQEKSEIPDEEHQPELPSQTKCDSVEKLDDCWSDLENLFDPTTVRKTWEAKLSGEMYPSKELPYLSQAPLEVMEVICHHFEKNLNLVDDSLPARDMYKVEDAEFKKHLLYLLSGIESTTFVYRDGKFRLNGYPYINGVSCDCFADIVQPLLQCGQLVRSINSAVWNSNYGPVRNALAGQLLESVQYYQELVEEHAQSESLLAVLRQMNIVLPFLQLMDELWNWPGWQSEGGRGLAFLQYLVDLSSTTIDDDERSILTAYFVACSVPFLTYLEHWLYRGRCCDPQREFFILPDDEQLTKRDRTYWTNGFAFQSITPTDSRPFVNGSAEEDAIVGLLNDIYLCGKTVHLLQLCQAKEPEHDEPSLRIGLNLSELTDIREECARYALRSPKPIDFVQPTRDVSRLARDTREAKRLELLALKEAKQLERAAERSARHALAKAELDEQLEMKRVEQKKKDDLDQALDADIQRYRDTIDQREAVEKRRLIMKYAQLLDDQSNLADDPTEDELNANEVNRLQEMDEENNTIPAISTVVFPTEILPSTSPDVASDPFGQPQPPKTEPSSKPAATRSRSTATDRNIQSKKREILTREEIKTKVLCEEFGIDPRYTKEEEKEQPEAPATNVVPYVPKDWTRLDPVSYPNQFSFDNTSQPELQILSKSRNWLQEAKPSAEEIRDLSLSFFVQRSLLLPVRTQFQIVNRSLMKLLVGPEHRLMQHLEVLRQYLFLDNGAFSHSLVKSIGQRLSHLTHIHQLINIPSMNFVLQSALNSIQADDYFASRLSFYVKETPGRPGSVSNSQLEALQCFTLRYRVGWPLNLILTEEVMDDYSQIFSFVLQLRLAAWALEDVYINLMRDFPCQWHAVHIARHSIYHFVQSLQNYVMSQLLTLAWTEFLTELKKNARSLDDLYDIHSNYVYRAKSRLLLTPRNASLMKIIRDALGLALKFRGLLVSANYQCSAHLLTQINAVSVKAREYAKFLRLILEKLNDRSHQSHLNDLLVKLNFNEFYRN